MTRLTLEQVSRENRNHEAAALHLSHRALSDVSCLGAFQSLERLDLSGNCLSNLEGLSSCVNLKWLSVVENKLESLKGVQGLSKLTVLNAGKNKLQTMDEITSVTSLQALILNDNNISFICKLDQLKYLNTLVLSRNPIHDIGDALVKVKSITKLSLSHCQIETIGSSLVSCADLKEARFSHNKIITLPNELLRNVKLQILDLGNNLIENWSDLKVLSALHNLKNLNLQGNPVAEKDKLVKKVIKLVPSLRIFNSKPIEGSRMREKLAGEDTLIYRKDDPPIPNASDVEVEDMKRKKPKIDVKASGSILAKKSSEEVHALPSPTEVEVEKKVKRNKSKKGADVPKKNIPIQTNDDISTRNDNDQRAAKKSNRKPENEESKFEGIDDAETPFADLILLDKTLRDSGWKKEDREVARDAKLLGGLVVDHTRKKKAKSIGIGHTALQLLPPPSEVGMGGPSTWDD